MNRIYTPLISFLVTCHNEGEQLKKLLDLLEKYDNYDENSSNNNYECVVLDDFSDDKDTIDILEDIKDSGEVFGFYKVYKHHLSNDYGSHKNYGIQKCSGKYIFQIDADEVPNEILLANLPEIFLSNPDIELFWVPRINDFNGVYPYIASQYGWNLSPSTSIIREKIIDDTSEEYKFLKENGYIVEETKIN